MSILHSFQIKVGEKDSDQYKKCANNGGPYTNAKQSAIHLNLAQGGFAGHPQLAFPFPSMTLW